MKSLYDEEYYECGIESGKSCYTNYRWIPELTIPLAYHLVSTLSIKKKETILDFGCAKGYLVYALRLLNFNAYGYDISQYAISSAPEEIKRFLYSSNICTHYDWILSKDVFEHLPYEIIGRELQNLKKYCRNMFCIVPLGQNGKYIIPAYELDTTHVIRESSEWWAQLFEQSGFIVKNSGYRVEHIKENWAKWEKGNGYFILESEA